MQKSKIEWCDMTWNPVTGCLHGCPYCYARKIAERFGKDATEGCTLRVNSNGYSGVWELDKKASNPYPHLFQPTFHKYRLNEPQQLKKPSKIFVCSMADLFGEWVPDEWIEEVFKACEEAPQHTYMFLTKNPKRYVERIPLWKSYYGKLQNIWLGTTITSNAEHARAWELLKLTKSINTFLSIEPLLGPVDLDEYELLCKTWRKGATIGKYLDWIIIGAETGNRKDKVIPKREWIENIVNQCRASNVPVFMKNSLQNIWGEELIQEFPKEMNG